MTPTALNLFFVQGMLSPEDSRGWEKFKNREAVKITHAANPEKVNAARRARYAANPGPHKAAAIAYARANPEKVSAAGRARYAADPGKYIAEAVAYARANRGKTNSAARARYAASPEEKRALNKAWIKKNPDKRRKSNRDRKRERRATDVEYRILCNLRTRQYAALAGISKSAKTRELIAMEISEFKDYLQGLFKPGMTWENWGPVWHIDHIRPCASFDLKDPAQQKQCFHWSNQQPLFAEENLKKGARYVPNP